MTLLLFAASMADMPEQEVGVALARLEGGMSRVEVKIDVALADLSRRVAEGEEDRRSLHGRITDLVGRVSRTEADMETLKARVGGAFTKYVTPTLAALALVTSTFLAVVRL